MLFSLGDRESFHFFRQHTFFFGEKNTATVTFLNSTVVCQGDQVKISIKHQTLPKNTMPVHIEFRQKISNAQSWVFLNNNETQFVFFRHKHLQKYQFRQI